MGGIPRVFVIRIVDFGRRRRIVAETAVVAAVQARVAVLMVYPAGPLVDGDWFAGRRWQRLRRRREERDRRWYMSAILTGHYRSGHRRRWRPVLVDTVTIRSTVRPGPCLRQRITTHSVALVIVGWLRLKGKRRCTARFYGIREGGRGSPAPTEYITIFFQI